MKKILMTFLGILLLLGVSAGMAQADSYTWDLNTGSTLPDIDYGWIKLTLNGTGGIDVTVNLTDSGAKIVETGFDASIAFNMADPDVQIGVTSTDPNFADYTLVNSGNKSTIKMDGFGNFEYGIIFKYNGGGAGTDSVLMFTVTRTGGFSSIYKLVENSVNPPGDISSPFAVDVIDGKGFTGIIGTTGTPVPEPGTLLLLGLGLVGLAGLRRKF